MLSSLLVLYILIIALLYTGDLLYYSLQDQISETQYDSTILYVYRQSRKLYFFAVYPFVNFKTGEWKIGNFCLFT